MTSDPTESFPRDIFGFAVPHPPMWTSYIPIPYLGWLLNIVFESFSIHGLVHILISGILVYIGMRLLNEKDDIVN